jgi:hypothetical protein
MTPLSAKSTRYFSGKSTWYFFQARAALGGFLRGFTGVASASGCCAHDHSEPATPAEIRQALSAQAARRGRCC